MRVAKSAKAGAKSAKISFKSIRLGFLEVRRYRANYVYRRIGFKISQVEAGYRESFCQFQRKQAGGPHASDLTNWGRAFRIPPEIYMGDYPHGLSGAQRQQV